MQDSTKNVNNRRRVAGVVSAILVLALLLTGTFAWMDYDQHKSNRFGIAELRYSATLNENFEEVKDWTISNPLVTKELNVTNTGAMDKTYGNVFVRLQLKEYFEITPIHYLYSDERYMVAKPDQTGLDSMKTSAFVDRINEILKNTAGYGGENELAQYGVNSYENFVTFKSKAAAEKFISVMGTNEELKELFGEGVHGCKAFTALDDVKRDPATHEPILDANENTQPIERWYIQTIANDPNGQYGKYVPLEIVETGGDVEVVTKRDGAAPKRVDDAVLAGKHDDGTKNCLEWHDGEGEWIEVDDGNGGTKTVCASDKIATKHDNGECDYLTHLWDADKNCDLETHGYVEWILGDDVITYEDWKAAGGGPVKKWIINTKSTEGWVYWGAPLAPGESTTNLLEAVNLIDQPDGMAYYVIHTEMEAVDLRRTSQWATGEGGSLEEELINGITDTKNVSLTLSPTSKTVEPGETVDFTAVVTGSNDKNLTWSLQGATDSKMDGSKLVVGTNEVCPSTLTVTVTHQVTGKTASAIIKVDRYEEPKVAITSNVATVPQGENATFTAAVTGSVSNKDVVWSLAGEAKVGVTKIDPVTGVLTVAADETATTLTVTATNTESGKSASVDVAVTAFRSISLNIDDISLLQGESYTFKATVTGAQNADVEWSLTSEAKTRSLHKSTLVNGVLKVDAAESADIVLKVTAYSKELDMSATATVAIREKTTLIINNQPPSDMSPGDSHDLGLVIEGGENPGFTVDVSGATDPATGVDKDGNLVIGEKETVPGKITITITPEDGDPKTITVDITAPVSITLDAENRTVVHRASSYTFKATAVNSDKGVSWKLADGQSLKSGTKVTAAGVLTVDAAEVLGAGKIVLEAYSNEKPAVKQTVTLEVGEKITVVVDDSKIPGNVSPGDEFELDVEIKGTGTGDDGGFTVTIKPGGNGTEYIPGKDGEPGKIVVGEDEKAPGPITIVITPEDGGEPVEIVIPVIEKVTLALDKGNPSVVYREGSYNFKALVAGNDNKDVKWSIVGPAGVKSTITPAGNLVVNSAEATGAGKIVLEVSSVVKPSVKQTVTLEVKGAATVDFNVNFPEKVLPGATIDMNNAVVISGTSGKAINVSTTGDAGKGTHYDEKTGILHIGENEPAPKTITVTVECPEAGKTITKDIVIRTPIVISAGGSMPSELNAGESVTIDSDKLVKVDGLMAGDNTGISWSVEPEAMKGFVTVTESNGKVTIAVAKDLPDAAGSFTLVGTSKEDENVKIEQTIAINKTVEIEITTKTDSMWRGEGSFTFVAEVTGSSNKNVTWGVAGNTDNATKFVGSVLSVGAGETAKTLTVTATSAADTTKKATADVKVLIRPYIEFTEQTDRIKTRESFTFKAVQYGTNADGTAVDANAIEWELESTGSLKEGTKLSAAGVLTIDKDEQAGQKLTVVAVSKTDKTVKAAAEVEVYREIEIEFVQSLDIIRRYNSGIFEAVVTYPDGTQDNNYTLEAEMLDGSELPSGLNFIDVSTIPGAKNMQVYASELDNVEKQVVVRAYHNDTVNYPDVYVEQVVKVGLKVKLGVVEVWDEKGNSYDNNDYIPIYGPGYAPSYANTSLFYRIKIDNLEGEAKLEISSTLQQEFTEMVDWYKDTDGTYVIEMKCKSPFMSLAGGIPNNYIDDFLNVLNMTPGQRSGGFEGATINPHVVGPLIVAAGWRPVLGPDAQTGTLSYTAAVKTITFDVYYLEGDNVTITTGAGTNQMVTKIEATQGKLYTSFDNGEVMYKKEVTLTLSTAANASDSKVIVYSANTQAPLDVITLNITRKTEEG